MPAAVAPAVEAEEARRGGWWTFIQEVDRAEEAFQSRLRDAEAWVAGQADLKLGSLSNLSRIGRRRAGGGHYGCNSAVYSAEGGGHRWAIKIIYNIHRDATSQIEQRYGAEYTLQSQLRHPNIMRLLGHFVDRASSEVLLDWDAEAEFVGATSLCFASLLMQGTLKVEIGNAREEGNRIGDAQFAHIALRVACGLAYMAQQKIAHRDLKPDNVLLGEPKISRQWAIVQVGDFGEALDCKVDGMSSFFGFGRTMRVRTNSQFNRGGAMAYLPPEVVTPVLQAGVVLDYSKSDVWALGVTMHEMLSASALYPFLGDRHASYSAETYQELPEDVPPAVRELVRQLLATDMRQRPDASAVAERLSRPWELVHCWPEDSAA